MKKRLSEQLKDWRADRPDEWKMDGFIRKAKALEELAMAVEAKPYRIVCNDVNDKNWFDVRDELLK